MNSYKLSDFKGFEKNWRIVTVRFREDTSEMRFTFANEVAWKHLLTGTTDYPNGAVFGKISILTKKDLSFPSSVIPSGGRRIQFMVRNKEKHKDTSGWGYSLFSIDGKRFSGDIKSKSMACASCHALVKDRGEVFSKPMSFLELQPQQFTREDSWFKRIQFETLSVEKLPHAVKSYVKSKSYRSISGILKDQIFYGTLDEIRPILIEEVKRSGMASGLVATGGKQYSFVINRPDENCRGENKLSLFAFHTVPNSKEPIYTLKICEDKNK